MENEGVVASQERLFRPPRMSDADADAISVRVRPFATTCADLDITFEHTPRPLLVTHVLASCVYDAVGAPFSATAIAHWNVNQRLQVLQAVAAASGIRRFSLPAQCSAPACGESMELELDLADFNAADTAATFACQPDATNEVRVRLPTGADQIEWLNTAVDDADALQRAMATRLVIDVNGRPVSPDWHVPPAWIDAVAGALEQHDHSTDLELQTRCPGCDQAMTITFDLEARLLAQLHTQQRELMDQIHRLASAYHWTETEILALTSPRRRYYLARIAEEFAR
jgi:hypothetical protein